MTHHRNGSRRFIGTDSSLGSLYGCLGNLHAHGLLVGLVLLGGNLLVALLLQLLHLCRVVAGLADALFVLFGNHGHLVVAVGLCVGHVGLSKCLYGVPCGLGHVWQVVP